MELRSKSRDLNVLLKAEHRQYIEENPNIVNLIGDFLQVSFFYIRLIELVIKFLGRKHLIYLITWHP